MPDDRYDLERLLAPIAVQDFLNDMWEKQPLSIARVCHPYYAGLFSLADLDSVIAYTQPRFTDPGAFPGVAAGSRTCVQGWLPAQSLVPTDIYPDIGQVRQVYAQGKTIIIRGMQERWPAIATLCRNLAGFFHCPVHCNLYLTPPRAQGFNAHFDAHEVFALQIDGTKHWRLYGRAADLPLAHEKANVPRSRLGPPREIRLEPGDLLYIPRGFAHEAFTTDRSSLHLTVGVNVHRWADLLRHALEGLVRDDARFRESLPPGVLLEPGAWSSLADRFQELLQAFAEKAKAAEAACRLGDEFLDSLSVLPGSHFVPAAGLEAITLDTLLLKKSGAVCRLLIVGENAVLRFPGGEVSVPARLAAALRIAAASERFRAGDLPDDLDDAAKIALVRRLVREGLLQVEASGATRAGNTKHHFKGCEEAWEARDAESAPREEMAAL